ncbi:hypothetical protein [Streptomyces cucumeris]|uniref:hypothetical protein n=1 Tax=Streptomyces cucumeris TaxID=2962890 RepID=UPI003EBDBF37
MSGRAESGSVSRAVCLVFGARELDESDAPGTEAAGTYCQFEKDWDAQLARCARLAEERGYASAGSCVVSASQPALPRLLDWADDPGCEIVLVASARLLARIERSWPDWTEVTDRLKRSGARVEAVPYPEPTYPGEELQKR